MKPKTDHFSLTDCRKSLTEHEHPLLTLTKGEYEALVSRLEFARSLLHESNIMGPVEYWEAAEKWLASLEAGK